MFNPANLFRMLTEDFFLLLRRILVWVGLSSDSCLIPETGVALGACDGVLGARGMDETQGIAARQAEYARFGARGGASLALAG